MSYPFIGFTQEDFDVFHIPGLEPRMQALITHVRPKLEQLGALLAPSLSALCGEEMYAHVAKHARRSVNPPDDTWVAFANRKRGYKALPHFQVGLWSTHVFIQFAIIYESLEHKHRFAEALQKDRKKLWSPLPDHYEWSLDHMKPEGTRIADMQAKDVERMVEAWLRVKKSEVLCGLRIDRKDALLSDGEGFLQTAEDTFRHLLPLYRAAF